MKLNGENIKIAPLDMNMEGPISKGRECTRFDLVKVGLVRVLVNSVLDERTLNEVKFKDLENLRSKTKRLLQNKNTLLFKLNANTTSDEESHIRDIEFKLNKLLEEIQLGNREAGEEMMNIFETYDSCQSYIYNSSSEKLPEIKNLFVNKIRSFSNDSGLKIDMEKVEELVAHAKFIFHDNSFRETTGGHDVLNDIYVNIDALATFGDNHVYDILPHTIFHELLHAISEDWDNLIFSIDDQRPIGSKSGGVSFSGNFNRENNKRGFVWLNEAFTETFSIYISGSYDKDIYLNERRLLDLLIQKGKIDLVLRLSKLYFRHILKDKGIDSTEEWQRFSKEVDSVFGPRFLVKLDIFIEKNGIQKALEIIEKWEDGKPMPETLA